jgi:hypothetical protein
MIVSPVPAFHRQKYHIRRGRNIENEISGGVIRRKTENPCNGRKERE